MNTEETLEFKVSGDLSTIDRIIKAVLEQDEKLMPYARKLAGQRTSTLGQFVDWMINETEPDFAAVTDCAPDKAERAWEFFLSRAKVVSISRTRYYSSREWTNAELIRQARIGQWPTEMTDQTFAEILDNDKYGSNDGYGRWAPFLYLWIVSPQAESFLKEGKVPSLEISGLYQDQLLHSLFDCLRESKLVIPVERLCQFHDEFRDWLDSVWNYKTPDYAAESCVEQNHDLTELSEKLLQEMAYWSSAAANELARRRVLLEDPDKQRAERWVSHFVDEEFLRLRTATGEELLEAWEQANSPIVKRAIWNVAEAINMADPENPFSGEEVSVSKVIGEEPAKPTYAETVSLLGLGSR